jgi:hypothetical protein
MRGMKKVTVLIVKPTAPSKRAEKELLSLCVSASKRVILA